MNEAHSVFAKSDSLFEVPYVEPSFLISLNVKSMIRISHDNDMNKVMCYMNYDMCHMYVVVSCVQNVKYDGACYYHCKTFLIKIWKAHTLY